MTRSSRRGLLVRTGLRRGDDTGSLAMALMLTIVALSLSALFVPMVVTQVGSTRHVVQRVDALNAAQSGVDVALGQIRAANDGNGNGQRDKLPCGPLHGSLDTGSAAQWRVRIDYPLVDPPQGLDDAALDVWLGQGNRIPCNASAGVMNAPRRALLRAVGTDGSSSRSLRATYTFQTTNANIPGGLIHAYRSSPSATDLCLDATTATDGTDVQMRPCDSARPQQKFGYTEDLTLVLTSSKSPALCLEAGATHAVNNVVELKACVSPAPPRQRWGANDQANFEGTADGKTRDGFCFNVGQPGTVNSPVVLGSRANSTCGQQHDSRQTFVPEAAAGAGAAGTKTSQLVNFYQFGRCLDVPHGGTYTWGDALIAWPCKQSFEPANPASLNWNQVWKLPSIPTGQTSTQGRITTSKDATTTYCLQGPASATATSQYVVLAQTCGTASTMTWTVYGDTGSYETSYRIKNDYGYCLAPTDPATDPYVDRGVITDSGMVKVEPCGASTTQKWNAPPNLVRSGPLSDISER